FFQAEDGIRDLYVTGVQTCALPIYLPDVAAQQPLLDTLVEEVGAVLLDHALHSERLGEQDLDLDAVALPEEVDDLVSLLREAARSEERRVGKECRARGWRYGEKNDG